MPAILLLSNPAHAKRHGQGTHFFVFVKGEVVGRLAWDLSPTLFVLYEHPPNTSRKKWENCIGGRMRKCGELG